VDNKESDCELTLLVDGTEMVTQDVSDVININKKSQKLERNVWFGSCQFGYHCDLQNFGFFYTP